jgi:MFS family permease
MTATPVLIAPLAGMVADRIGSRPLMAAGLLAQAVGLLWLTSLTTPDQPYAAVVLPLALAGAANTLRQFGGAMGVALAAAVFAAHGHLGSPAAFDAGLRPALATAAGLSALGALAALAVPARPRRRPTPSLVAAND